LISRSSVTLLQFVPEELPTFRADVSALFGKYLPRHDVRCDIVGMASESTMTDQGFESVRRNAPHASRLRREFSYLLLCIKVLFCTNKKSVDLIQVRDMVSIGFLAMLIARIRGIPFVYWMSFLMCEGRIEIARDRIRQGAGVRFRLVLLKGLLEQSLLYRLVLPAARHIFVQSDVMLELMSTKGIAREKLTAVPMGVDTEALQPTSIIARRLEGWDNIPFIAYLGTLDRFRRLEQVVDALAIVRLRHPSTRLLFIGDASSKAEVADLLAHAKRLGLADAVHVTGWLPAAQALSLLAGADAAISFYPRGELFDVGTPTKLLESLALGIPSVGNDNPDQAQVLSDSQSGWLTESNAAALANAVQEILDDTVAARERAKLGPIYIDALRSYRVIAAMVAQRYQDLVYFQKTKTR
jgi:glycosyltransferase involved in cell wall biosynthesis